MVSGLPFFHPAISPLAAAYFRRPPVRVLAPGPDKEDVSPSWEQRAGNCPCRLLLRHSGFHRAIACFTRDLVSR